MNRFLVAVTVASGVLAPASAHAARAWDPPALLTANASGVVADGAADGTHAVGWVESGSTARVVVEIGDGQRAVLDIASAAQRSYVSSPQVAVASRQEAAVAWARTAADGTDTTVVAFARDGVFGAPALVGAGRPVALAADPAGDMTIVVQKPPYYSRRAPVSLPADDFTAYRPAGGAFGPLTELPINGYTQLAISPTGESVFGVSAFDAPLVVTRTGNGPMATHALDAPSTSSVKVAADAQGRMLAGWVAPDQGIHIATRTAAGAWTDKAVAAAGEELAVGTSDGGDGLIAWTPKTAPPQVAAVSLADGSLAAATAVGTQPGFGLALHTASDGSALVAYQQSLDDFLAGSTLKAARRDGTGAFTAGQSIGCTSAAVVPPVPGGFDGSGNATLYVAGRYGGWNVTHDHAADVASDQPCVPDPGPSGPLPRLSRTLVITGAPITLDAAGAARSGEIIRRTQWDLDADGAFERASATSTGVTHTFIRPGRQPVTIQTTQFRSPQQVIGDVYDDRVFVDVYAAPKLTARRRQHGAIRVKATALTTFQKVPVVLSARSGHRTLGRISTKAGPQPTNATVPMKAHARRLLRRRGRLTVSVTLRQAGKRLARTTFVLRP